MKKNTLDRRIHYPIRFGRIIENIRTLGPGSRTCIWLQGCSKIPRCPGCTSPEYQPAFTNHYVTTGLLSVLLEVPEKNGRLTISGGEPLDQPYALYELLLLIRQYYKDILLYTGNTLETLTADQKKVVELVDVVIDGPYIQELDNGCPLRGSSNQRILFMPRCSEELKKEYHDYLTAHPQRETQFIPQHGELLEVGIPSNNTKEV